jgi:hypothetical protein
VTGTEQSDAVVEKFARNGGTVIAVLGGLVALVFVAGWIFDPSGVPLVVPAVALFGALVVYLSTVRPRVLVMDGDLVLRNMLSTVRLPLASVEEIAVRQVLAVRAGGKRYVCSGVGRTLRQALKGSAMQRAREQMGGLQGEIAKASSMEPGIQYADFVEIRIQELVNEDRTRRGVRRYSPESAALAEHVRREPAYPELAALVALAVFIVVAVLVG